MMVRIAIFCLAIAVTNFSAAIGDDPVSQDSCLSEHLGGRKTVTVYADSEAAAFAEANRRNPGWSAIKAKKVGDGKAYQVAMTKD